MTWVSVVYDISKISVITGWGVVQRSRDAVRRLEKKSVDGQLWCCTKGLQLRATGLVTLYLALEKFVGLFISDTHFFDYREQRKYCIGQ